MNISKEVNFVKAKEPVVVSPTVEKATVEKKRLWLTKRCRIKPLTNQWSGLKLEQNHFHDHKEVLEQTMCVITVDFKDTPDPIVISLEH